MTFLQELRLKIRKEIFLETPPGIFLKVPKDISLGVLHRIPPVICLDLP